MRCKGDNRQCVGNRCRSVKVAEQCGAPERANEPVLKWKVTYARPVTFIVPLVGAAIVSGDKNTNTSATWYRSLDTQAVDWRHRIASSGRVASRGLHFHASTRNWPMIAGGRLHSYNDVRTGFVILTLETLTQNKRNNGIHTKGSIVRA